MESNKNSFSSKRSDESPLNDFMKRMDAFFYDSFRNVHTFWNRQDFKVNIHETEESMIVEAVLPGYSRDQVEIEIMGRQLRIAVEDTASIEEINEKKDYYKKEQSFQKAERIVSLPFNISRKDTKAAFHNGILTITVPKHTDSRSFIDIEDTDA